MPVSCARRYRIAVGVLTSIVGVAGCGIIDGGDTDTSVVQTMVTSTAPVSMSVSSSGSSTSTMPIVDVDPRRFALPGMAGYYRWIYPGSPARTCGFYPAGGDMAAQCFVTFPAGAPEVRNGPFHGSPNEILISVGQVVRSIGEELPAPAKPLQPGERITVSGISCTALVGGIECTDDGAGFRFVDGRLREW
ncbi:hypothetical protein GYA93_15375 [Gordonia desulfuricans]|uniref:Lipoprotein n=1 Tax=Gordonia desulfuricans TaxID=89051 RepID=A0A7K3LRR9_9ACTN|nr:hypothetical protein [Gordonia desulfuricans]NDK90953.1 hypothetical protein [Gordonia desulfuricans]